MTVTDWGAALPPAFDATTLYVDAPSAAGVTGRVGVLVVVAKPPGPVHAYAVG